MDALDLILVALAGTAFLLWLGAPLLVRLTFRHDAVPTVVPRAEEELPGEVQEFLAPRVDALEDLGFADCGRASIAVTRGSVLWLAILRNDRDEHMACVSVATVSAAGSAPRLHRGQVEYATMWPDGREVLTSNLAWPLPIEPLPAHDLLQVPDENDLGLLLRIHGARVARLGRGRPANPPSGREVASVETVLHQLLEHQAARGWFRLDEARSAYRATLAGAWRLTKSVLFPYAHLARRRLVREARGTLARLGMERSSSRPLVPRA